MLRDRTHHETERKRSQSWGFAPINHFQTEMSEWSFFLPVRFRGIQAPDKLFSFPSRVCNIMHVSFVSAHNKTIKGDLRPRLYLVRIFPPVIIVAFSISEQNKTSKGFIKLRHHFIKKMILFSHDAVVLLQSGSLREHRRALTTHCTANSQGAWEQIESSRCISGSTTVFFPPVFFRT